MRMLVLGAGLQGTACAYDLLTHTPATVTLADHSAPKLPRILEPLAGDRLRIVQVDARDHAAVQEVMRGQDAVMSAFPYYFNLDMARIATNGGAHFCDLGGNTEIVRHQEGLADEAIRRGISIVPDCGVAPGMANIIAAEGIRRLDRVDAVKILVGGLPQHPTPPLNYSIVYSLEGVLDYYTTPSWVLRGGRPTEVDALSEVELVEFPEVGALEAFHTGGGVSTMPWVFEGKIPVMEYKTLRYPGHAMLIRAIRELGLLSVTPISVKGVSVAPRDLFIAVVDPKLRKPDAPDLLVLRIVATGTRQEKPHSVTFQMLDRADTARGISAMMRTTGFSLAITGWMQATRIIAPGAKASWQVTPFEPYVAELRKRGIDIRETGVGEG